MQLKNHEKKKDRRGVKLEIKSGDEKKNCINAVKMQYYAVEKGTVEYYRRVYMEDGLKIMIEELEKQFKNVGKNKLSGFVQAILYGYGSEGKLNECPPSPNPDDITEDYKRYKFQERVYARWINKKVK